MKILAFFLLFIPVLASSQTKKLNLALTFHVGNGPFEYALPAVKWNDTLTDSKNNYPEFKNIPSTLKNIRRGRIYFDFTQYIYQNFLAGTINKENFIAVKNAGVKFNEKLLSKKPIKCYINLIYATNMKNEKVCMVDANNNYDFSDDIIFVPVNANISDKELNKHLIKVECERFLNDKIVKDYVPLLIAENEGLLVFSIAQYATATLKLDKRKYKFAVCPLYFLSNTWKSAELVLLTDSLKEKKADQSLIFKNGDFVQIGENVYTFDRVDIEKNSLTFRKITSEKNKYSSQVGFYAPLFQSEDLLIGKEISLASFRGKYVFIDFWGTWCYPCRQQLPDLIKLKNSVDSSQITFISIASNERLDNFKKVIVQENMTWPQIVSDKITSQYHISVFPTSLLLNPQGIIIAKDLSMDDLKKKFEKLSLMKENSEFK